MVLSVALVYTLDHRDHKYDRGDNILRTGSLYIKS